MGENTAEGMSKVGETVDPPRDANRQHSHAKLVGKMVAIPTHQIVARTGPLPAHAVQNRRQLARRLPRRAYHMGAVVASPGRSSRRALKQSTAFIRVLAIST